MTSNSIDDRRLVIVGGLGYFLNWQFTLNSFWMKFLFKAPNTGRSLQRWSVTWRSLNIIGHWWNTTSLISLSWRLKFAELSQLKRSPSATQIVKVDIKAEICSDLRLTHTWQALNCLTHPCLARPPRSRSGLGLLGLGLGLGLLLKAEILLH